MYESNDIRSDVFKEVARFNEFVRLLNFGSPESSRYDKRRGIRDNSEYCMVHNNSVFDP